jgi:HAD superfamily hydrolase (TIGR01450 family)
MPTEELVQLFSQLDAVIFDCDGVVWTGLSPCPGAQQLVAALQKAGKKVLFVTNNSAKGSAYMVEKFASLGFPPIAPAEVMTAATAASLYLTQQALGGKAYVIGMPGLVAEIRRHGIEVVGEEDSNTNCVGAAGFDVEHLDQNVTAVVVGFDGYFSYAKLLKASMYLRYRGACFIRCAFRKDAQTRPHTTQSHPLPFSTQHESRCLQPHGMRLTSHSPCLMRLPS